MSNNVVIGVEGKMRMQVLEKHAMATHVVGTCQLLPDPEPKTLQAVVFTESFSELFDFLGSLRC